MAANIIDFFYNAVHMKHASEKQGHPVFEDREFIRILIPGDSKTVVEREVKPQDRERYAEQYKRWKATGEVAQSGTPVEQWPPLMPSQVAMLKALNIFTVEALATLDDGKIQNLGIDGRKLVNQAEAWLASAEKGAEAHAAVAENEHLQAEVKRLTELAEKQSDEIGRLQSIIGDQPKPARKRKERKHAA